MADREKVINGLKCHRAGKCELDAVTMGMCPYWGNKYCQNMLMEDALELLKEQEPVKPVNVHMYRKMFANVRSGYCPICNNPVDEEEGNNFCCTCGRRLNWDD